MKQVLSLKLPAALSSLMLLFGCGVSSEEVEVAGPVEDTGAISAGLADEPGMDAVLYRDIVVHQELQVTAPVSANKLWVCAQEGRAPTIVDMWKDGVVRTYKRAPLAKTNFPCRGAAGWFFHEVQLANAVLAPGLYRFDFFNAVFHGPYPHQYKHTGRPMTLKLVSLGNAPGAWSYTTFKRGDSLFQGVSLDLRLMP